MSSTIVVNLFGAPGALTSGRRICTDCIEDEWKELMAKEKFERLREENEMLGKLIEERGQA